MWLWCSHSRTPIYLLWPKPSRAGLEIWPTLSLIESPGPVEQRDGREGRRDGAKERGQTAWLGDAEPINFPLQPISHVLLLCPFLLMTHFLCPSAHFQAWSRNPPPLPPQKKQGGGVCIRLGAAGLRVRVESTHSRGLSELASVKLSSPPGLRASRREAPQVSSSPLASQQRWLHPEPCQCRRR